MASATKEGGATPSPMMAQYLACKAEAPGALLLFRMGDFYELFLEDAVEAAGLLDIALTHRGQHLGQPLPMCGVPVPALEGAAARLVAAGRSVAIAEQMEAPAEARKRGAKAIVHRAVTRVLTPGTLTEERLLRPEAANRVLAGFLADDAAGLAWADISTGEFMTAEVVPAALGDELARLRPAELLWPEGVAPPEPLAAHRSTRLVPLAGFDSRSGMRAIRERFGLASLDGLGAFGRAELAAASALLGHLDATARGAPVLLQPPRRHLPAGVMAIDRASRRSLEIVEAADGGRAGSLLETIDLTVTAAGARLLADEVAAPLTDIAAIEARLDCVQTFRADAGLRTDARRLLRQAPDLARALGRLGAGRGRPVDLAAVRDALGVAVEMASALAPAEKQGAPPAFQALRAGLPPPEGLFDLLRRALVERPPARVGEAGAIAAGFDAALDELRDLSSGGRRAMAGLEAELRQASGVPALKVRHNGVLGFHVEVPVRHGEALMAEGSGFRHRQTLGSAMRFDTEALRVLATRIAEAEERALAAEQAHLEELTQHVLAHATALGGVAAALAAVDRAAALAERAAEAGWVRPVLTGGTEFAVSGGRHPVVEAALQRAGQPFVPNDCRIEGEQRLWLLTGPNMGGKSTFLRQNALVAILAQAGSFVPARAATIGVVDRLYSRVGASDRLSEGQSTFMVEMVETAAILNGATARSLVLLDEVGRGTSTWDGLSLAWAVLEDLHDRVGARTLFASHYHELEALAVRLERLSRFTMAVREWQGRFIFLHEVAPGAAVGSFGLEVARLAGVPAPVLARAGEILAKLEAGDAGASARTALAELPLFATTPMRPPEPRQDPLRARLAEAHPDSLSPRAALELLYELKRLADDP
ncbi:MAG: DNA mismatch repair protein MutS [Thermaurantiacus sp.]